MRFFLLILSIMLCSSFLHTKEPSFNFSIGSKIGNIPLQISKTSQNIKAIGGIKLNSWILSPKFSSFISDKSSHFSKNNDSEEILYIKFKFKF